MKEAACVTAAADSPGERCDEGSSFFAIFRLAALI